MMFFGGRPIIGFGDLPCPSNPAPPPGYVIWRGPVPPELTQWAIVLRDRIGDFPYGQQWSMTWRDTTALARKDHHTWTYKRTPDGTATLVKGICIPGITLYRLQAEQARAVTGLGADPTDPADGPPDPDLALYPAASALSVTPPERTDWTLVSVSAAAIATVAGIFAWGVGAAGGGR